MNKTALTYDEYLELRPNTLRNLEIKESDDYEMERTLYQFMGDDSEYIYIIADDRQQAIKKGIEYYEENAECRPEEIHCCKADKQTIEKYKLDRLDVVLVA